ncbi:acyl-CoA thioesterase [Deinococcus peraridilitoris]|uniref:Acyl-CoA thioester hydrolase, YbgC/YbaW family n=1 Tax=Deinococcus peraridilitoris (strain DSM 19664 / LMG 22246 / CIP 109416 / KR-200) TaxID=937777 RepID=L0A5C3_DEIPD|nr:thioesterase family protein [Deinococcus peraridilitoris]AFZ68210.1 acyl-CoA thioester hydrolase, YbgC/YbaW family [Deinococcus peraridilitoris DSM 19664]
MSVFRYLLRVRYSECDAQKVVFNARYGEYIDLATTELMRAVGFGEALGSGELDYQLVKQVIEWNAPAQFDQVLELSVWAEHLGTTSFTLRTDIRIAGQERVICSAQTVNVQVDGQTLTKKPLSPELRSALQSGAAGRSTDHAGYLQDACPS